LSRDGGIIAALLTFVSFVIVLLEHQPKNLALLLLVYLGGRTTLMFSQSQTGVAELTSTQAGRLMFRLRTGYTRKQRESIAFYRGDKRKEARLAAASMGRSVTTTA